MSNSRTRIPSPARSMPLTPRRRETPRRTRSVCSPARSDAPGRLSCIIREHREQFTGSFILSPLTRKSVLTDNTDIQEPGRQSWWKDLDENSRDVMEVLKDNNAEPHNIFENIEVLSQEEKHYSLDIPDSSDSESIHSIVIPQKRLFHQKENQPQKKFNQFGTRETLEKLHKKNAAACDNSINAAPKELFQNVPRTKPVFPTALLDISANTTASEKTMTAVVETKVRVHNFFNNQQNEKNNRQTTKHKNMFAKFIESDSEEELPEIQSELFALQKKTDSRRPSMTTRGLDTSIASSMDIELDDWQLLPSSTMVDHQLNTTLTAGQKPKRPRLSKLSEAETGTNSDSSKTTQSTKSISLKNKSKVQEKSPQQNTSIVTRNSSKISKEANEEISKLNKSNPFKNKSKILEKSPETQNTSIVTRNSSKIFKEALEQMNRSLNKSSQSSVATLVTQTKNKSHVANKSQNESINKSRNSSKSKNTSKASISLKQTDENVMNKSVLKSPVAQNQNKYTDDLGLENKLTELSDNEDDNLNFTLEYNDDNADEAINEEINASKNTSQKDIDPKENKLSSVDTTDKNVQNAEIEVMAKFAVISENKMTTQDINVCVINDENINEHVILSRTENVEEEAQNRSQKSPEQSKDVENNDKNNDVMEHSHIIEQEDEQDNNEDKQNERQRKQNDTQEIQHEIPEVQNESQNIIEESKKAQNESRKKLDESEELQHENEEAQNESQGLQDEIEEAQNESQNLQNENEQSESQELQDENEEALNESQELQNESEDARNEIQEIQDKSQEIQNDTEEEENESEADNVDDDQNISQEETEQNESEVDDQEMECDETNKSTEADSDQDDNQENDSEENDSEQENDMECEDAIESVEAAVESDNQEESNQHEEDGEIENTETPNVSHDTTGRNRKKSVTPEAILRDSRNEIDLTRVHGRNTSVRKTKSMIQQLNIRQSLEPARESMEICDGTKNSSAEGSGWDSHRTTRKTLRQTFGKDFTPRKSLRALVMEKSAKRRATAVNDASVAMPQANSTELPEYSTNDYEMHDDEPPAIQEVSLRTRQATIVDYLEKAKKDWAEENAKVEEIVKLRLEHGRTRIEDPFKVPARPTFLRNNSKPKPKAKKPLQPFDALENLPEEFMEDMKYKPPKRFAPRNAAWLTNRLYKYLETKLEPKYSYKARVRAEKFAQMLHDFVCSVRRRGAPDAAPAHAVHMLKREMARLNFVKTHFDFYNFFHEFMPREVRIKVVPDIVNKIPHPKAGVFSDIL